MVAMVSDLLFILLQSLESSSELVSHRRRKWYSKLVLPSEHWAKGLCKILARFPLCKYINKKTHNLKLGAKCTYKNWSVGGVNGSVTRKTVPNSKENELGTTINLSLHYIWHYLEDQTTWNGEVNITELSDFFSYLYVCIIVSVTPL